MKIKTYNAIKVLRLFVLLLSILGQYGCIAGTSPLGIRSSSPTEPQCSLPNINKIVVLVNKNPYQQRLENYFMESLINKGYQVSSRKDIPVVIEEIAFQNSGNTAGSVAQFGKIISCDAVLLIELTDFIKKRTDHGGEYIDRITISARLINVETSRAIWMSTKSYNPSLLENILEIPFSLLITGNSHLDSVASSIMKDFPHS
jgi:hypothetical protein